MVKFTHLIFKEGGKISTLKFWNLHVYKICILKSFKKLYKTIKESISWCCRRCLLKIRHSRVPHRHSNGTWTLEYLKDTWALGHLRHLGTQALETLRHSRHLSTWILRHLGTRRALWALRHASTWSLEALKVFYLADQKYIWYKLETLRVFLTFMKLQNT